MRSEQDRVFWKRALSRPGVWGLLFCLAVVLFNWPLLAASQDAPLMRAYFLLFALWAGIVACLFLVCRAVRHSHRSDEDKTR